MSNGRCDKREKTLWNVNVSSAGNCRYHRFSAAGGSSIGTLETKAAGLLA